MTYQPQHRAPTRAAASPRYRSAENAWLAFWGPLALSGTVLTLVTAVMSVHFAFNRAEYSPGFLHRAAILWAIGLLIATFGMFCLRAGERKADKQRSSQ